MANNFNKILDECIDRINRGESLESCLADYREHADQLEPLLRAMLQTKEAYSFEPSMVAKRAARQRFNIALEKAQSEHWERKTLFTRVFARRAAWATLAAAIIILVAGYFGLKPMLYPTGPSPGPEGNFVFLISDDVNAISDFDSLNVSISKIGLQPDGSDEWVEFKPEVKKVDLTMVQGDKTQEIWRGNIPEGHYSNVFIYVADVQGILKETGQTVAIKLPSQKLHISKSFQIITDAVTVFTYDLTVITTGNAQSEIKYLLKPQVDQSGVHHLPSSGNAKSKQP